MSHWMILPIVVPALLAAFTVTALRHHLALQRIFSVAGSAVLAAIAVYLWLRAAGGEIEVYALGNWRAPFGIVLVLDRLAALMVALTALLGLAVAGYAASSGWDRRGRHFHALLQFQLMGLNGAFLTGDIFNLFVFFEVLLIASYGLMIHGGGARRLRAGVQYVVYNLLGSTLFLFALGTLYAATGTLNMADIAQRLAGMEGEASALVRTAAILLLCVFAVKAAMLPLHFWLPETYSRAPAPVAALFAVMTKVGAYAILRVMTLILAPALPETATWIANGLMLAALGTLLLGTIGVLGAHEIGRLAAFAALTSVGTLMVAVAAFTPAASAAAMTYLVHSVLSGAMLFLAVDLIRRHRSGPDDGAGLLVPGHVMPRHGLIAALFFAAAIAAAGMPPLSGFPGKLLILDALRGVPFGPAAWAVILATSILTIFGFARAGSMIFWKVETPAPVIEAEGEMPRTPLPPAGPVAIAYGFLAAIVLLTLGAGAVHSAARDVAAQLYAPEGYIAAVLGDGGPGPAPGTMPTAEKEAH